MSSQLKDGSKTAERECSYHFLYCLLCCDYCSYALPGVVYEGCWFHCVFDNEPPVCAQPRADLRCKCLWVVVDGWNKFGRDNLGVQASRYKSTWTEQKCVGQKRWNSALKSITKNSITLDTNEFLIFRYLNANELERKCPNCWKFWFLTHPYCHIYAAC